MRSIRATVAAALLVAASPAVADIVGPPDTRQSDAQGTNVLGPGPAEEGAVVVGDLGNNSGIEVFFSGTTTGANDWLRISGGQASVTGAEINSGPPHNDFHDITALDISLTNDAWFDWIELSLMGTGSVTFNLTDDAGTPFTFANLLLGPGENWFGFDAVNGQSIATFGFTVNDGGVTSVRHVRITPAQVQGAIPEPGTWAMMLLGFAGAGIAIRRSRRNDRYLPQIA